MSRNRKKNNNTFFRSFWRETGKNTGKWASNKIFGNTGWATPRRHIIDGSEGSRSSSSRQRRSGLAGQQNSSNDLGGLQHDVNSKIVDLSKKKFPSDTKNLIELMFELEVLLNANKWKGVGIKGDEEHKITNQYADALFMKYKQGVEMLKVASSKTITINRFIKKRSYFNRRRVLGKYGFWIKYLVVIIVVFSLIFIFYE
jgi:hypothetical protein